MSIIMRFITSSLPETLPKAEATYHLFKLEPSALDRADLANVASEPELVVQVRHIKLL